MGKRREVYRLIGALIGLLALVLGTGAGPVAASTDPLANPPGNIQPPRYSDYTGPCQIEPGKPPSCASPCFPNEKFVYNGGTKCADLLLAAVNAAQRSEHLAPLVLPSNYSRLSVTGQLLVLVNLERLSRGVPPLLGISPYLDPDAAHAARASEDPVFQAAFGPVRVWLPPGGGYYGFGSTWAGNSVNALAALFGWMYDDGWGGSRADTWNFACTAPGAPGCWGHRDILLGKYTGAACTDCLAGAAYVSGSAGGFEESYTFLIVRPVQPSATLVFSWDAELRYLPPGWERHAANPSGHIGVGSDGRRHSPAVPAVGQ